jgi:tetratricopeptide (TPR) repeat protein
VSLARLEEEILQAGWSLCPEKLNRACVLEFALSTAEFAGAQKARDWTLMGMVEAYSEAGDFEAAMHAAEAIEHVTFWPSAPTRIAKARAAAGDPEAALAIAWEILDPNERVRALTGIIEETGDAKHADSYREALSRALAASEHVGYVTFLPQALGQIAAAQAAAGRFDDALSTAAKIAEVDATSREKLGFALAKIAHLQAEVGEGERAKGTIQQTLDVLQDIADERPREGILLQIMNAQIAAGDLVAARATGERLGDTHRLTTLALMYSGYMKAHDGESAGDVLESALQLAEATTDPEQRAGALAGIALSLARAGEVERSRQLFHNASEAIAGIGDVRAHAVSVFRLSTAMHAAGDPELSHRAIEALRDLTETDGRVRTNPLLLVGLAEHLAEFGDVTAAMAMTAQIGDTEGRVRALVEIAKFLPN